MRRFITLVFLLPVFAGGKLLAQGCGDGPSDDGTNIFGFVQSQYEMIFEERHTENSFTFERVRLGVQGAIPYDFSYYAVVELSPFMDANRNPYLLDAFVTYDRFKWARLSVGSFKTPFGLETNMACNDMITIFRSTATMQMIAPFRDMGMVLMGGNRETKIQYQLGIMNGSGLKRFDNNRKKDIVARLIYKPFDFLQIGGNFRTGYPSYNNDDDSRTTFGGELKANYKGFTFMGEYIMDEGNYNRDLGGGCGGELITLGDERSGGWAAIAYRTKWEVEPVFKFDFFDSGNAQNYKETNLTFGINYFFNDWTRLQINYVYRTEEPTDFKNDRFVIQLQAKF